MNKRMIFYTGILVLAATCMDSCSHEKNNPGDQAEEKHAGVSFTREQIKQAGIRFGQFEMAELSHDVYAKGKVTLPNDRLAEVNTMIGGMVTEINVHHGVSVKKGAPLCRLVHPDIIKIQQQYLDAKYDLAVKENQFLRQQVLVNDEVSSKKNFQMAERDYLVAKTEMEALASNVRLAGFDMQALGEGALIDHLDIVSPINGKVDEVNVYLGQYVVPGTPLFRIVDKSDLHIELMIFEKDIPFVAPGQRVTMTLSNISDRVFEGVVYSVGSTMGETSRTIPLLAHLDEIPENSYPGMFVAATIHTGESLFRALPENAIVAEKEGENYIYYTRDDVETAPEIRFDKVPVEPGLIEDGYASMELLDSLPDNARIVISGGYYIRSVMVRSLE